ncbi:probable G-protein coupled receptor Mth-like 3 [Prorops nasuta]|uniref:probable G-protein coupled receptor Mth-like 3 n=1 Tax=Prorops nasuta TaxID=863751 RepID=UPI0034CD19EF
MTFMKGLSLIICLFATIFSSKPIHFTKPCSKNLALTLDDAEKLDNGSLSYNGLVYPPNYYWKEDETVYGCPCNLTKCVRRCCEAGKVLNESACIEMENYHGLPTMIRPLDEQLAPELRWITKIEDSFYTIDNMYCPGNFRYLLDPKNYDQEKYVLQESGVLKVQWQRLNLDQLDYCLVWSLEMKGPGVVICSATEMSEEFEGSTIYKIGIGISIFSFLLTILVYSIVPDLRNLHGLILMSHLVSLMVAYSFLLVIQLGYTEPIHFCVAIGFLSFMVN